MVSATARRKSSLCFFFSSRRRHTRWPRDWSSDVCSSDLGLDEVGLRRRLSKEPTLLGQKLRQYAQAQGVTLLFIVDQFEELVTLCPDERSEERRVGKEGRSRWSREPDNKKKNSIDVIVLE